MLTELETSADSADIETGVHKFVEWARSGKLEIKAYPTENLHAKVYIMTFAEGDRDKGRVITGSSNLSQSGLQDNLEFNVELKNRADYDFALAKFNELWAIAVDVSKPFEDTVINRSPFAQFTPRELYLKFLYEYFRDELNRPDELEDIYVPADFKRLKYQEEAVLSAMKVLREYGGLFLSDVVGLGKTYMAALLAQQLDGRSLVIAPPHLLDKHNRGSWPNVFGDFRVPHTDFESLGKPEDLLERDISKYANVFIDESHRFRTETTQTYEMLAQHDNATTVALHSLVLDNPEAFKNRTARFVGCPIQLKAALRSCFSIDKKYEKFPNLILAYLWNVESQIEHVTFALTYAEAVSVADAMGYTGTASWSRGLYSVTKPGPRLARLLEPCRMSPPTWWKKVVGVEAASWSTSR